MLGSWEINVQVGKYPQKVASALEQLDNIVGAEYTPIAYLGSQVVNGTNHAVLAEQKLVLGKDVTNVVLIIFHETKEGVSISNIERIVESGGELGGIKVDVSTTIPEDAKADFDKVLTGHLGAKIEPFAYLGSQVTKGTNYIFAAKVTPIVANPVDEVALVTVNALTNDVAFVDFLRSKQDTMALGYAFTWLRYQDSALGKPLGEWP